MPAKKSQTPDLPFSTEVWPIDRPKPYSKNPRKITDKAIAKLAQSIQEYGFRQPIVVDEDDVILVGHTRLLGARKAGLTEVPVHVAAGLTQAQRRAYRIADNRTHQEADWDLDLLAPELAALQDEKFDLHLTAFDDDELARFLAGRIEEDLGVGDGGQAVPEVPVSRLGDVWLMGEHRLLCGDSTMIDDVQALMDGAVAHMVFTDPPYNVDYDPEQRHSTFSKERTAKPLGKIQNDRKSPEAFREFLDLVYSSLDLSLRPGGAIYICHADTEGHHFRAAFVAQPWKMQSCLIWRKTVLVFGRADYHWIHEPILYGWKEGASHSWHGDRKQISVWDLPTDHYNNAERDTEKYVHPTQKPVALITKAIENSSVAGDIVLDLFGGSGSTLIACQKTGRAGRLMELDPKYCDVIVKRWQQFTGRVATLESTGAAFSEELVSHAA